MKTGKLNFAPLKKVMDQIDDNGRHGRCGNWEMGLGGYDMGYEIYYRGAPIGRVNYGDKEYELYDDDFMPKELVPEFLAAIDARRFKDVGYHEQDDEGFDDDGPRYVQESIGNLESFLAEREKEFKPSRVNPSWDESEDKVWAVQDYLSSMGSFTDEDREYLRQTAPELLSLEENEDDGDQNMVNEARKQIMWAVNFRSMHTAVHGLYYGKDKKRVQEFAQELEYINDMSGDGASEDYPYLMQNLFDEFPDIETVEEFNYRDIVDLPGGYEGIEIGDTIYRFVNRTSIDVYNESTGKQKMKFRKIVNESSELQKFKRAIEAAKNRIIRKVDRNGVVENLGQDEVRRLRDDLDDMVYSGECEKSDELQMGKMIDNFDDWASTYTGKTVREADEGKNYDGDTPKIYVGTYAKYNDGSIDGKWIDLTEYDTYEEFVAACRELHKDEKDPEFMVQDYENFPEKWYHEGGLPTEEEFDKINEYYMMDDSEKDAYAAYVSYTDNDSIDDFHDAYQGKFDSAEDFAYHIVDSMGWDSLGQENLDMYFDYDSFGRDLMYDFHIGDPDNTDSEGEPEDPDHYYDNDGYDQGEYESDRQVAEDYVDSLGGVDQLGPDTARNYFDYDSFGRDLFINDYFEEDGYVFSRY